MDAFNFFPARDEIIFGVFCYGTKRVRCFIEMCVVFSKPDRL